MSENKAVLGFDAIQEPENNFKPTIEPGIHDDIIILGFSAEQVTPNGSPYIQLNFTNKEGTQELYIKLWVSEVIKEGKTNPPLDSALRNVKHIASNCLNDMEKTRIKGNNYKDLLISMLNAITGKSLRMKFGGEEFIGKDGQVKVKTVLPLPAFAESMSISRVDSALRFNPNSQYDFKKLPANSYQTSIPTDSTTDNPFA